MLSKEELTKRWMILEGVCANEDYDPGPILSHIDAQTEQLKEARGLLEENCPACRGFEWLGHTPDCPIAVLKDTNAMLDQFRATPSGVPEELMGHHEDIKFLVFKLNEVIAYLRRNHEDHT